jgi:1,4-alpha-glucan branching enzyme
MKWRMAVFFGTALLLIVATGCAALVPAERPASDGHALVLWMPGASGVQVLGDWNEWGGLESAGGLLNPDAGRMTCDGEGFWTVQAAPGLEAGRYRYSFLIDGWRWMADPGNPETAEYAGRTVSLMVISD